MISRVALARAVVVACLAGLVAVVTACSEASTASNVADDGGAEGGSPRPYLGPDSGGDLEREDAATHATDASITDATTDATDASHVDGGDAGTPCSRGCAAAASANCSGQALCQVECENDLAAAPAACRTIYQAVVECGATSATWICNANGRPRIAGGCDAEVAAAVQCINSL